MMRATNVVAKPSWVSLTLPARRGVLPQRLLAGRHTAAGFTLIELLVVVSLLGLLAVGVMMSMDGVDEKTQLQLAHTELQEIKKALRQFKLDVGRYPKMEHPADFNALILGREYDKDKEEYESLPPWDPVTARGWRGPYLSSEGDGYVTISDDLVMGDDTHPAGSSKGNAAKRGDPGQGTPWPRFVSGVADPFVYPPSGGNLVWLPCANCEDNAYRSRGRPYYVFDLDKPARARIVSSGPNGKYESQFLPLDVEDEPPHVCSELFAEDPNDSDHNNGDDIILCLQ